MKKINPKKFYTPKEVLSLGIMTASNEDTQKQMLLRAIRQKKVVALNLGTDKRPRYVLQGKHITEYANRQIKPGQYEKK